MQTRNALGFLGHQYRNVLNKCRFANAKLAAISTLALGIAALPAAELSAQTPPSFPTGKSFEITSNPTDSYKEFTYNGATYGVWLKNPDNPAFTATGDPDALQKDAVTTLKPTTAPAGQTFAPGTEYDSIKTAIQGDPNTFTVTTRDPSDGDHVKVLNDYYQVLDTSKNPMEKFGVSVGPSDRNVTANFFKNTDTSGGAINNNGYTRDNVIGDFIGNGATGTGSIDGGGAIYNHQDGYFGNIEGNFIGNYAAKSGGAISNYSGHMANIKANFIGNSASNGGAIDNDSTIGNVTGNFIWNTAITGYGGAINNFGGTIGVVKGDFSNNVAHVRGGAIATSGLESGLIQAIEGDFVANTAHNGGGAIWLSSTTIGAVTGDFVANKAEALPSKISTTPDVAHGGAIWIDDATLGPLTGDFVANSATGHGGAIYSERDAEIVGPIDGSFIANTAGLDGGAIYTNTGLNFLASNSTNIFSGNYVLDASGTKDYNAIYVSAPGETLTFTMEGAGDFEVNDNFRGDGYNLHITGDDVNQNTFTLGNELFNTESVNISDAALFLSSATHDGSSFVGTFDITSESTFHNANIYSNLNPSDRSLDLYSTVQSTGSLNLENVGFQFYEKAANSGGQFFVNGDSTFDNTFFGSNTAPNSEAFLLQFNNDSTLRNNNEFAGLTVSLENGARLLADNTSLSFTSDSSLNLDATGAYLTPATAAISGTGQFLNANADILITDGKDGQTVYIAEGLGQADAWQNADIAHSSALFSSTTTITSTSYSAVIEAKNIAEVYTDLSPEMAGILTNLQAVGVDTESADAGIQFLSQMTDSRRQDQSNTQTVSNILNSAADLANASALAASTVATGQAATKIYGDRTLTTNNLAPSGGDSPRGWALWATPFYQSTTADGLTDGNFTMGYDLDLSGVSVGGDHTASTAYGDFRFGLAATFGRGELESSEDFSHTNNDQDFWGLALYGSWNPLNNFTFAADLGYTRISHDIRQKSPDSYLYGDFTADTNTTAFTAGLNAEYLFRTTAVDIRPHLGLRYFNIETDSFATRNSAGTIFNTSEDSQNFWQVPVGLTFSKEIASSSGWLVTPSLDLGLIASFGDLDSNTHSTVPGLIGTTDYSMAVVDDLAFAGGASLNLTHTGGLNLNFGYDIQASDHQTNHLFTGTVRYNF